MGDTASKQKLRGEKKKNNKTIGEVRNGTLAVKL